MAGLRTILKREDRIMPRERQKLQPRSIEAILNATQNRINRDQNRWEGTGGQGPFPVWNQPNPRERSHSLHDMSPGWLEASAPRDNTGIMSAAMTDTRPDFKGNWLMNSDWGNRLLSLLGSRYGDEETQGRLQQIMGGGGLDLWGGTLSPKWGDDGYGFNWKIGLGG